MDTSSSPPVPWPGGGDFSDAYDVGAGLTFGASAGFVVSSRRGGIGAGVRVTRSTHSTDIDSEWTLSDPINTDLGIFASDRFAGGAPDRRETAVHLHAIYQLPLGQDLREQLEVRFFAGPSWFRVGVPASVGVAEMATSFLPWSFEISRLEYSKTTRSITGGHIGADLTWYFSEAIGIGASAVYSRGSHDFEFSLQDAPGEPMRTKVTAGGLASTVELRFRF